VLRASADGLVLGVEFSDDIAGGALAGEVLLAEPGFVEGNGAAAAVDGDAGGLGLFDDDVPGQAGLGFAHLQEQHLWMPTGGTFYSLVARISMRNDGTAR
jgi:hypothetical protein